MVVVSRLRSWMVVWICLLPNYRLPNCLMVHPRARSLNGLMPMISPATLVGSIWQPLSALQAAALLSAQTHTLAPQLMVNTVLAFLVKLKLIVATVVLNIALSVVQLSVQISIVTASVMIN